MDQPDLVFEADAPVPQIGGIALIDGGIVEPARQRLLQTEHKPGKGYRRHGHGSNRCEAIAAEQPYPGDGGKGQGKGHMQIVIGMGRRVIDHAWHHGSGQQRATAGDHRQCSQCAKHWRCKAEQ